MTNNFSARFKYIDAIKDKKAAKFEKKSNFFLRFSMFFIFLDEFLMDFRKYLSTISEFSQMIRKNF